MNRVLIGGWGFSIQAVQPLAHRLGASAVAWHDVPSLSEPTVLIGWSLGGVVATQLCQRVGAVKALVTVATPGDFAKQVDPGMYARLNRNVRRKSQATLTQFSRWISDGDASASTRLDLEQPLMDGLERLASSQCVSVWSRLPQPQLHLVGEADALFQDPNQVRVPGGHCCVWQGPQPLADRISDWIERTVIS